MTADPDGPRVPRQSGRHVFTAGATGSGKTTSALRAAAGRVLKDRAALFYVDQKGDPDVEVFLRNLAGNAQVPFVLFDPRAKADSDHWQPLWARDPERSSRASWPGSRRSTPTTPTRCACTSGSSPRFCTPRGTGRHRSRCSSRRHRSRNTTASSRSRDATRTRARSVASRPAPGEVPSDPGGRRSAWRWPRAARPSDRGGVARCSHPTRGS